MLTIKIRVQDPTASVHLALSLQSLSLNAPHRALDEFGLDADFGGDDEMADPFALDAMFDPDTLSKIEQCGVDMDTIMNDYLMALIDTTMEGDDNDPMAVIADLLNELKEEGEVDCTEEEMTQYMNAANDYLTCTGKMLIVSHVLLYLVFTNDLVSLVGLQDVFEKEFPDDLQEQIQQACATPFDPVSGTPASPEDLQQCLNVVLGDNAIGDMIRDLYHHPDKYCNCMASFAEALPECLVSIQIPELGDLELPLSLLKKETCLIEIACEAIDDTCMSEFKTLDECLPKDDTFSCLDVIEGCQLLESSFFMLPPQLTQSQLPTQCVQVYQDSKMDTNVIERYEAFNAKCGVQGNDEHETTKHAKSDDELTTSATDEAKAGTASPLAITAVLLIVAAFVAILYIVIKKRRAAAATMEPRSHFDPVMVEEKDLI